MMIGVVALTLSASSAAHADATLTYEVTAADGSKTVQIYSASKFFVRIEEPANKDHYLLFQAGKFFPLYSVDLANSTYTRLTPEVTPYMSSHARVHHGADKNRTEDSSQQTTKPAPDLKPTKKKRRIAGVECRVVHELEAGKPVIEHCMANSARLGVTERDVITMARTFEMSRNRELGWIGVSTEDESFISIQSRDLRDNRTMQLTAVSAQPLAAGYLRIPKEYQQTTKTN